ncbi:translation elongation factor 2 (EF-2/EF-G) [Geoalkalibacter ferrihydriticus]|uniref:Elongation factor G n=2 Tax=Geoalkalibacter ferrihydriticus TaxID=392333 RepID=A0A0C2HN77_9BACT|nr:elongation factor G [Geoalkalibacter ferrihydriticus]KIH76410.1 elongation factor G [Geoalkalibacter ferrihydriticus DSM 17813]SDL93069.1 translation elongation factor 2 (EF-2/EF-G) [Geoalkalibacter ferrihydriticus]
MGKYDTSKIRNLGIVAHGGAGKTSLVEAILFDTGMVDRLGRVTDGTSNMDFEPEEIKRGITLSSSLHHCEWQDHSLHIVDTPGFSNFLHDTRNCLRILGGAVVIVSAISGVKAQTQKIWEWCEDFEVPRIAFVNKMDRERADFLRAVDDMSKTLGNRAVVVVMPIGAEAEFRGIIDLVRMKARLFQFDEKGTYEEGEIPAEYLDEAKRLRTEMLEAVADADDELMEKYLENETLSEEEILRGLREGTLTGTFTPVLCGSATANIGIRQLLDYIVYCLPSPIDKGEQHGKHPLTGAEEVRQPSEEGPFSAMVFKTISDPYTGKLTLMRVYSGSLKSDSSVYNPNKDVTERVGQIFEMEGKKQKPIPLAVAGDIIAIAKLKSTATGDTLCDAAHPILFESPMPLKPVISFALQTKGKGDEDKLSLALHKLIEEDPTLQLGRDEDTREMILSGMGQVHLEVAVEKLKRKFGVEVELKEPKVPYRETISGRTKVQGKYKKQSGGRGQFGDVWIEMEPLPRSAGYEFVDKVVGGVVPRQYIPAVDKGIQEASLHGILAGYPVVDFRVTLVDGSHHSVDSSEMAFKVAGSMAFKKALEACKPVLLEPLMVMEISVPDDCMGDVIGDMNSRRGKVLGVEPKAGSQLIRVQVPMAEVLRYAPELRSMTSDRGMFTMEFSHYEEVPPHLTSRLLTELKKAE